MGGYAKTPYVEERFRQGCRNGQELWHEITAQGYKGSCRTVYRFLEALRENQEFMHMIRHLKGERLDDWLALVKASQIPELQSLVRSIKKDKAAVFAGLTLLHNNGVVEGKVNKLKLIKRMMFGRAGFALLRQRVLHAL